MKFVTFKTTVEPGEHRVNAEERLDDMVEAAGFDLSQVAFRDVFHTAHGLELTAGVPDPTEPETHTMEGVIAALVRELGRANDRLGTQQLRIAQLTGENRRLAARVDEGWRALEAASKATGLKGEAYRIIHQALGRLAL